MSLKITTIVILKIQLNQLKIREQNCTNTMIEQIKVQLNHINIKPNYDYYYYYSYCSVVKVKALALA